MNWLGKPKIELRSERLLLRLPDKHDYMQWSNLRAESHAFLAPWEPTWAADHLRRSAFARRVKWSADQVRTGMAVPLFMFDPTQQALVGAITIDNIRRGPSQSCSIGYWIGERYARQGYMQEAIAVCVQHAFGALDLSRVEAACLPNNTPSRNLLEKCGFKYEGVAQSYLQIAGRWRTHVLYAALRYDRRGSTTAGIEA